MDYRGTAVIGVWIGTAAIIGLFIYSDYLAGVSLWLFFAAFVLTGYIIKQTPEGETMDKISQEHLDYNNRLTVLEEKVTNIIKLLEE